jgi:hypothetical protein
MTPLRRFLVILVSLILLAVTMVTWLTEAQAALAKGTTHRDSLQFYTGGTLVREGRSDELYDFEAQGALQEVLLPLEQRPNLEFRVLPFVSPPFVALTLAPLTNLTLPQFYVVSGIGNLCLLAVLSLALQRAGRSWPESWRITLFILVLSWLPVTWVVREGQVSILLALSFALGYLMLKMNRDVPAGIALSLLWIKPQYAILIVPALLLWKRRQAVGSFAAASVMLLLASLITVGFEGLIGYVDVLLRLEQMGADIAMFPASYHTLSGFLLRLFGVGGWAWFAIALVVAGFVLQRIRGGFSAQWFALLILGSVLVSPHTHIGDVSILLVPIALGLEGLKERPRLAVAWLSLWIVVAFGFYALVINRYLLRDGPMLTVPAMLAATSILLLLERLPTRDVRKPVADLVVASQ